VCSVSGLKSENIDLAQLFSRYSRHSSALLGLLLDLQDEYNYLPKKALKEVAAYLGVTLSQVYSVATFYKSLTLKPRGRHIIKVCLGTACHLRGAPQVLTELENILGITPGGTTEDLKFSLETVNCLGACALAPVMVIDDQTYGEVTPNRVQEIIQKVEP